MRLPARTAALPGPSRRHGVGALGALLALAAVSTAAAPGGITVRRGDTLSQIAVDNGTTVAALRAANGLSGSHIEAGDRLVLPGGAAAPTTTTVQERQHVVTEGENATVIARRYGTTVAAVRTRNALPASGLVTVGQVLVVPVAVRGAAPAAAPAPAPVAGSVAASAAASRAALTAAKVPTKDQVRRMIGATARRYGVDQSLALAVAFNESGFQQRVVSPVNAVGVMQVLPSTGRNLDAVAGRHLDLLRTEDNVTAGVLLLRQLLGSTSTDAMALAGYYQGFGSIARKGILPQTTQYIRTVEALRPRFANG